MSCYYVKIKAQSCLNSNLLDKEEVHVFVGKPYKNSNLPVYTKRSKCYGYDVIFPF